MKRVTKWMGSGALLSVLALSACSGSDAQAPGAQQAAGAQVANTSEASPEVAHLGIIRDALDKVALRPEQKTEVDQLAAAAKARHEAIRIAHTAWRGALADQVVAGKIDRDALKPQIDAIAAAVSQSTPADRAALVRLHDILDKSQRDQFVTALESGMHTRMRAMHDGRGGPEGRGGPRQWAADLNLSDTQRDQIRAALRDSMPQGGENHRDEFRAAREHGQKLMESFRSDNFMLDANAPPFLGHDRAEHGAERMINLASVAVPLLRPEQRAIAAEKLRSGAMHP